MKILMIGDISGSIGRDMIRTYLPVIKQKYAIDFIVANGENVTHGRSLSFHHYQELKQSGIDVITSGNHIFQLKEVNTYIDQVPDLLRPANWNPYLPGKGTAVFTCNRKKIRVTNLMGQTFILPTDNPYACLEQIIKDQAADEAIHLVDFHAETTSEKIALAWAFDGKITTLVGTHTHVQTADAQLLPRGTAFITDLGMTGGFQTALGVEIGAVIKRLKTGLPTRFEPPKTGPGQFCAVIITIDDRTNQAVKIEPIFLSPINHFEA